MKDYPFPAQPLQGFDAEQLLTLFASHHQKMVLVDNEDTANAIGFVMGPMPWMQS